MDTLEIVLHKHFKHSKFRPLQKEIIQAVLEKNNVLVIMATGIGKSLCYQLPAVLLDGITLVISPLIALMNDQVQALKDNGINAEYLNSSQTKEEQDAVLQRVYNGDIKLLYIAPERLAADLSFVHSMNISLIAIDEAHCIDQWGHDFRPDYLKLHQLKKQLPNVGVIALTATATPDTQKNIIEKLQLKNAKQFISSFNRININYSVQLKKNATDAIIEYIARRKQDSGIIYCMTRASCEKLASIIKNVGVECAFYHAGMDAKDRNQVQADFKHDRLKIIVATIAFGMGIDKPNVRYVIHYDMPKSIESYYQETGRVGRDGLESEAILFYDYNDLFKLKRLIETNDEDYNTDILYTRIEQMDKFASSNECRRRLLLNYFGEDFDKNNCGKCDNCMTIVNNSEELFDATKDAMLLFDAIRCLKENFGQTMVVDLLRGSKSKKIMQWFHSDMHGKGTHIAKNKWCEYISQLIKDGYIVRSGDKYPILKLTAKCNNLPDKILLKRPMTVIKNQTNSTVISPLTHSLKVTATKDIKELPINVYIKCDCKLMAKLTTTNDNIVLQCEVNKCKFRKVLATTKIKTDNNVRIYQYELTKPIPINDETLASIYTLINVMMNIPNCVFSKMHIHTTIDTVIKIKHTDILTELQDSYNNFIKSINIKMKMVQNLL